MQSVPQLTDRVNTIHASDEVRSSVGWFRAMRSPEAMELLSANPNALLLAYLIAFRAQFSPTFNRHRLNLGEALLGDWEKCGMTRQQGRTAMDQLSKWGFATFKATNKGTVAKLVDTRLFAVFRLDSNQQPNKRATNGQPTANHRATTTEISKKEKKAKEGGDRPPGVAEQISLKDELERIEARLKAIRDGASETALGVHYTDADKQERSRLKGRQKQILSTLGWQA